MAVDYLDCVEINPSRAPDYVVIWLHGLGADGHDFEPIVPALGLPADLAVRFVFPHAPFRSVTINAGMVMRAWYDILEMDVSRKVDADNIMESAAAMVRLMDREQEAGIASQRIILAGFSQGGAIILHAGLRYERPLAGLLALSTYLPTLENLANERSAANHQVPIMMAHGRFDPIIPMAHAINTRKELARLQYDVEWHEYPMQHEVCLPEIADIGAWMLNVMQTGLDRK